MSEITKVRRWYSDLSSGWNDLDSPNYPSDVSTWDASRWSWEFLRRNPVYWRTWCDVEELRRDGREDSRPDLLDEADGLEASACLFDWHVSPLRDPRADHPPHFFVTPQTVDANRTYLLPPFYVGRARRASDLTEALSVERRLRNVALLPWQVGVVVDLAEALDPQLVRIATVCRRLVAELDGPLSPRSRMRPELFSRQLRVLDARRGKVTFAEIADRLGVLGEDTVRTRYERAEWLTEPAGYLAIARSLSGDQSGS